MDARIGHLAWQMTTQRHGDRATRGLAWAEDLGDTEFARRSPALNHMQGAVDALQVAQPFVEAVYELLEELALPRALRSVIATDQKRDAVLAAGREISVIRRNVVVGQ